ncbi:hypothetical protein [Lapillicoccus jejuensis]|uniref:DUF5666 domain-containing protein n=1 Tax=Lapillicoccus jejuensis TaxID=402171 RepID=A0A542E444_9MICO|nr:hypothetical protein [Lapillicoccus jejuensis]TQJ10046.1 hypothetical protein FB458_3164 [Lapillicoccus jejuensis]
MWTTRTRALVIGGTAVVLVGGATAGTIAVANASDSSSTTPSATASATPGASSSTGTTATKGDKAKHRKPRAEELARLKDVLHAEWTTKDKAGKVVTHDAIRGTVTAVSGSSITVKAADGVNETYALGGSTKVTLGQGKGVKAKSGSVGDLKTGANVVVLGTGTSSLTADRVLVPAA